MRPDDPSLMTPNERRAELAAIFAAGILRLRAGEMMLRYMGWTEAADLTVKGNEGAVANKTVTYDFERLMKDAKLVSCSSFGDAIIANM